MFSILQILTLYQLTLFRQFLLVRYFFPQNNFSDYIFEPRCNNMFNETLSKGLTKDLTIHDIVGNILGLHILVRYKQYFIHKKANYATLVEQKKMPQEMNE